MTTTTETRPIRSLDEHHARRQPPLTVSPYLEMPLRTLAEAEADRRFLHPDEVRQQVDAGLRWKCRRCGSSMVVGPRPRMSEQAQCGQCTVVHWSKGISAKAGLTFTLGIEPETHAELMGEAKP